MHVGAYETLLKHKVRGNKQNYTKDNKYPFNLVQSLKKALGRIKECNPHDFS